MLPKLREIRLKSGQLIDVSDSVTAIVGPNNAGKSVVLREVIDCLSNAPQNRAPAIAVDELHLDWPVPLEQFLASDPDFGEWREAGVYPNVGHLSERSLVLPGNGYIPLGQIQSYWGNRTMMGPLTAPYAVLFDAQSRLGLPLNAGAFNQLTSSPQNPAQWLWADRELERKVSALVRRAFGSTITVNRYAGSEITLHLGSVDAEETPLPGNRAYLEEIAGLAQVQTQGDGVRAFIGILLVIMTSRYRLIVLDEPEAFLHPPQARVLGEILSEHQPGQSQILVATHSQDILQGLTVGSGRGSREATVVRLTRKDDVNHVAQVTSDAVRNIYSDPLMRYSDILDGLFYSGTVICEGDSDCTYYKAVLNQLRDAHNQDVEARGGDTSDLQEVHVEIHITHCGGKARAARAVQALRQARVPAISVTDFDVLQNDHEFFALTDAHGIERAIVEPLRNSIVSAIQQRATKVRRVSARAEIEAVLSGRNDDELVGSESTNIKEIVSPRGGWRDAKKQGKAYLTGGVLASFESLDALLREKGMFIVPVGELEKWHPTIPQDDKPKWLHTVLDGALYEQPGASHDFVSAIQSTIAGMQ